MKNGNYDNDIEGFKSERNLLKGRLATNLKLTLEVTEKLTTVEPLFVRTSEKVGAIIEAQLPEKE